jgi:hypothetical protein
MKEHSRYKVLLTKLTNLNVGLYPPSFDVESTFHGLHLGLEVLLFPLLELEAQLGARLGEMPHLRLWTLQKKRVELTPERHVDVDAKTDK